MAASFDRNDIERVFELGDAVRWKFTRGWPGERGEVVALRCSLHSRQAEYGVKTRDNKTIMWADGTQLMPWRPIQRREADPVETEATVRARKQGTSSQVPYTVAQQRESDAKLAQAAAVGSLTISRLDEFATSLPLERDEWDAPIDFAVLTLHISTLRREIAQFLTWQRARVAKREAQPSC